MADIFSKRKRSEIMSRIRGKGTKPERRFEKILKNMGERYVSHPKGILGNPDFLLTDSRTMVFVDGCFWHGCKKHFKLPSSNKRFWRTKIERNISRRKTVKRALRKSGYYIWEIWEHDIPQT